jgi:hypothetical protein
MPHFENYIFWLLAIIFYLLIKFFARYRASYQKGKLVIRYYKTPAQMPAHLMPYAVDAGRLVKYVLVFIFVFFWAVPGLGLALYIPWHFCSESWPVSIVKNCGEHALEVLYYYGMLSAYLIGIGAAITGFRFFFVLAKSYGDK